MRMIFVCALAAIVAGCSCYAPPQASIDACTASGLACLDRSSLSQTIEPEPAALDAETSDQVIAKAKITVAAKLEDPASAEFGEMKRTMRTNTLGHSIDTICGHVKGKKASGESTGDRPFLYLVKDDEAYVVDGAPTSAAATAYRNICN